MAIQNEGKLLLQNSFKDTVGLPIATHARLKGEESFLGDPNPVAYFSSVNSISWGTANASTGLPLSGVEVYDIVVNSGTTGIAITGIEFGVLDGSTFTKYAEATLATAVFSATGRYTVTAATINFA
jgi:hypothetical protein